MLRRRSVWLVLLVFAFITNAAHSEVFEEETHSDIADELADHENYDLRDSWVPSFTFSISVHEENVTLSAENANRFAFDRSKVKTLASVRFGGELMTPTFDDLPWKPRAFLSAGLLWSTPGNGLEERADDTSTVNDYEDVNLVAAVLGFDRVEFTNPDSPSIAGRQVEDFEGTGNQVEGRQLHNSWFIGVGTVFTFPQSGFTLRVRPSIEYVGEEFRTEGRFTLLSDEDPARPRFVIHNLDLDKTEIHHNLGPALELEFVNHLDGNLTFSFFTQARFLFVVGDRTTTLKGQSDPLHDAAPIEGEYLFKRKRFNFRGGAGFRIGFRSLAFKI